LVISVLFGQDTITYQYSVKYGEIGKCDYVIIIDNPVNPDIVTLIDYKDTTRLIVFIDANSINEGYCKLNVIGNDKFKYIELGYYSATIKYSKRKMILSKIDPKIKQYVECYRITNKNVNNNGKNVTLKYGIDGNSENKLTKKALKLIKSGNKEVIIECVNNFEWED